MSRLFRIKTKTGVEKNKNKIEAFEIYNLWMIFCKNSKMGMKKISELVNEDQRELSETTKMILIKFGFTIELIPKLKEEAEVIFMTEYLPEIEISTNTNKFNHVQCVGFIH